VPALIFVLIFMCDLLSVVWVVIVIDFEREA
jgi:hypothetical protein